MNFNKKNLKDVIEDSENDLYIKDVIKNYGFIPKEKLFNSFCLYGLSEYALKNDYFKDLIINGK